MSQRKVLFYISETLSAKRICVNYTEYQLYDSRSKLQSQFYALDTISCLGAKDKTDTCPDDSLTSSWEFTPEFSAAIERMASRFNWEQKEFWKLPGKR